MIDAVPDGFFGVAPTTRTDQKSVPQFWNRPRLRRPHKLPNAPIVWLTFAHPLASCDSPREPGPIPNRMLGDRSQKSSQSRECPEESGDQFPCPDQIFLGEFLSPKTVVPSPESGSVEIAHP